MRERLEHHASDISSIRQEYYDRIAWWHERRNGVVGLKPENIGYENGVLGGVANALAVVCSRGDKVLVHAPTYTGFTNTLKNAGYDLVTSWLQRDAEGVWAHGLRGHGAQARNEGGPRGHFVLAS